ncbi:hypothetical protein THAOC_03673 [Thalassiosira oceanica]|uniref:Uncharacterized protein n=1 Tax=Thalassiosira oceanica TaxID=159749 RepID=K0TBZ0_THAOC|nr:hypothetical protein THAOC_03673 [Thalassiosira oceanica]|eukprot:EJK74639.1 hypothetical protein THAOC_03673 [Thalassiosira oceanica]
MIPGSPTKRGIETESSSDEDDEDAKESNSARGLAEYKKQAKKVVKDALATTYQPFKKFKVDKQLDRIRKDTRLNHIPKSIRDDSKSKKKIQVMKKRQTKKKYRLQSPRCAVCVWVYGSAKASRTIYRCSVCGIPLCTTIKGKAKKSCWDRFHTCSCLSSIETKKPAIPTRKSPRKEGRTGSVTVNVVDLDYVLFVVANESTIRYATLVYIPEVKRNTYREILVGVFQRSLKWAHFPFGNDPLSRIPRFRESAVSSASYPVDKVISAGAPLPPARHILPSVAKKWNHFKGRTDESTAALDRMIFPLQKAKPKMQLVLREIKKFALQVLALKKHCFLGKKLPLEKGFRGIQIALGHSNLSLKGVLHELALSYEMINPLHSMIPGSPTKRGIESESESSSDEDIEENLSARGLTEYQKQVKKYVTDALGSSSYQPFKKFKTDKRLDEIRRDTRLNHIPKSIREKGDSKRKMKVMKKRQPTKKYRVQSPRCVMCTWIYGARKASRTGYCCSTCGIPLCTQVKGKARSPAGEGKS